MNKYLIPLILFGSLILLMFVFVLTVLVFLYRHKKKRHQQTLIEISNRNKMELLNVKIAAQEELMKMLSLEIHDNICQVLGSMKLQLYAIKQKEPENNKLNLLILELELRFTDILNDLRNLSHVLNSNMILKMSLEESIDKELRLLQTSQGVKCKFQFDPSFPKMLPEQEVILFRIFQVAFYNIIKHAKATEINVSVKGGQNQQIFCIQDNGIGMNSERENSGMGLGILKERIKLLNGNLSVQSKPESGTKLIFTFKLSPYEYNESNSYCHR